MVKIGWVSQGLSEMSMEMVSRENRGKKTAKGGSLLSIPLNTVLWFHPGFSKHTTPWSTYEMFTRNGRLGDLQGLKMTMRRGRWTVEGSVF